MAWKDDEKKRREQERKAAADQAPWKREAQASAAKYAQSRTDADKKRAKNMRQDVNEAKRLRRELEERARTSVDKGAVGQLRRTDDFTVQGLTGEAVEKIIQGIPDEQRRAEAADIYGELQRHERSGLYREFGRKGVAGLKEPTEDAQWHAEYGGQTFDARMPKNEAPEEEKQGFTQWLAEKWDELTQGGGEETPMEPAAVPSEAARAEDEPEAPRPYDTPAGPPRPTQPPNPWTVQPTEAKAEREDEPATPGEVMGPPRPTQLPNPWLVQPAERDATQSEAVAPPGEVAGPPRHLTAAQKREAFRNGDYNFVSDSDVRDELQALDAQIKGLDEQITRFWDAPKQMNDSTADFVKHVAQNLQQQRNGLLLKKAQLAFPAEPMDAAHDEQTVQLPDDWSYGQGKLNALHTEETLLRSTYENQQAELIARMRETGGSGKAYWALSQELDGVQTEFDTKMEDLYRKQAVVEQHLPKDAEALALRSGADHGWLDALYEREIAISNKDYPRVQALDAQMLAAGFETMWPEEVAAMVEFSASKGDDVIREKLGIVDGRALTARDYIMAAQKGKDIGEWAILDLQSSLKKLQGLRQSGYDTFMDAAKTNDPDTINAYLASVPAKSEIVVDKLADIYIGEDRGYAQSEDLKDLLSVPGALYSGMLRGTTAPILGLTYANASLYYAANKERYGAEISWEQMRAMDSFFDGLCIVDEFATTSVNTADVDLSQRGKGVQMFKGVTEGVMTQVVLTSVGSKLGKVLTRIYGHTLPGAEKLWKFGRRATQDVGFAAIGYKANVETALAHGATYDQAVMSGGVGALISASVERMNDVGTVLVGGAADDTLRGFTKLTQNSGWETAGVILDSFFGEGLEEAIENPLQGLQQKLIYDKARPWYGPGGVVDPKAIAEDALVGGIAGGIMGGAGHIANKRIDDLAVATTALGSGAYGDKTHTIAEKVANAAIENAAGAPEWMRTALSDAIISDAAELATGQEVVAARHNLETASKALADVNTKLKTATVEAQKAKDAVIADPSDETVESYKRAQDIRGKLIGEQPRAQERLAEAEHQARQAEHDAKARLAELTVAMREVNRVVMEMPELGALWAQNVGKLGVEQGTLQTVEAARQVDAAVKQTKDAAKADSVRARAVPDMRGQAEALREKAQVAQSWLIQGLNTVSGGRWQVIDGGVKSLNSMLNKVSRKQAEGKAYSLTDMKDHARAALLLDDVASVPDAIASLSTQFPGLQGEAFLTEPLNSSGYRGIHLTVPMGGGVNAEIQISTPEAWSIKKRTDEIYEKWRNLSQQDLSLEQKIERDTDYAKSVQMWEDYYSGFAPEVLRSASDSVTGLESNHSPNVPSNGTQRSSENATTSKLESGYASNTPVSDKPNDSLDVDSNESAPNQNSSTPIVPRNGENDNGMHFMQGALNRAEFGTRTQSESRPKSPVRIMRTLAKKLGVGDYTGQGHFGNLPKAVRGYYSDRWNYMNAREVGDFATSTHEAGHAIQQLTGLQSTQEMIDSLDPAFAASYKEDALNGEAFAEFVRTYIEGTDKAVDFAGREFVSQFQQTLDAAGLREAVDEAAAQYQLFMNATTAARAAAYVVVPGTPNPLGKDLSERVQAWIRHIETQIFDTTAALTDYTRAAQTRKGSELSHGENVRQVAQDALKAHRIASYLLTEGYRMPDGRSMFEDGEAMGTSFAQALNGEKGDAHIEAQDYDDFNSYMMLKHSIERAGQDKPVYGKNITTEQASAQVAEYEAEHPEYVATADRLYTWWDQFMQDWVVDQGFLTQEAYDTMHETYPHYVPTMRVMDESGRASTTGGPLVKRAKGSGREIYSPVDTMAQMVAQIVNRNMTNEIARAIDMNYMQYEGLGEFLRPVATTEADADTRGFLERIEADDWQLEAGMMEAVRKDGTRVRYQIADPEMKAFFERASAKEANALLELTGRMVSGMTLMTTQIAPSFTIRNPIRDVQTSFTFGSYSKTAIDGTAKWFMSLIQAIYGKGTTYQEYQSLTGGGTERLSFGGKKGRNKKLRSALVEGYATRKLSGAAKKVAEIATLAKPIGWLNDTLEQTTRFAEYQYGKHDRGTLEGRIEAASAANEVTLNFDLHGASPLIATLRKFVPFFNPALQGTYKTARMFSQEERAMLPKRLTKIAVNALIGTALCKALRDLWFDDDDKKAYEQISDGIKMTHYILPNFFAQEGDARFIRLPVAQDALIAGAHWAAENVLNSGSELDISVAALMDATLENLNPVSTTIFTPLLDAKNNTTWYGAPIDSARLENYAPSSRFDDTTAEGFKWIGRVTNVSPKRIEYVSRQYTGFYGEALIAAISRNRYTGEAEGLGAAADRFVRKFTTDPAYSNDISDRYYSDRTYFNQLKTQYNAGQTIYNLRPGLSNKQAQQALDEARKVTLKGGALYNADKKVATLWDEIEQVGRNTTLTTQQKNKLTQDARMEMLDVMAEASAAADSWRRKYAVDYSLLNRLLNEGYTLKRKEGAQ